jgi:hypothetical protein
MMLAAVETVTKADPVGEARRHNPDVAAQATAREPVHAASPLKSSGRNVTAGFILLKPVHIA